MTVLEMMVVLAVIGGMLLLVRTGFRQVTKADLVENSTELSSVMRRASELAVEHGEMHRVVINFDTNSYQVEVCTGAQAIAKNEKPRTPQEDMDRAAEKAKNAFANMPVDAMQNMKNAMAVAGHHVDDRHCKPPDDSITGDAEGKVYDEKQQREVPKTFRRELRYKKGIKFKEVWVQHRDESATKGEVAIYFWPNGSSEKAVIELTDGSEIFSVLVYGLTGKVELHDGVLRDVNDHMMRNAMGDKNARREDDK